jgi:hypothetical protein
MNLQPLLYGILFVLIGYVSNFLVRPFFKVSLPPICRDWNKNHIMEASLFTAGILFWYAINYIL